MNATQIELIDDARHDAGAARNELRCTLDKVRSLSPSVQRSLESACEKLHTAIESLNEVLSEFED